MSLVLDSVCVRFAEAHPVFLISSSRHDTTLHVRCPNFNCKNGVRGVLFPFLSCLVSPITNLALVTL